MEASDEKDIKPPNPSEVLAALAKLTRALMSTGEVSWEDIVRPAKRQEALINLTRFLRAGCPNFDAAGVISEGDYSRARILLGSDFISPQEIARARGFVYNETTLRHFSETLPPATVLLWLYNNNFGLMAGTPKTMSLLDIRRQGRRLFYENSGGWYAQRKHRFSRDDQVGSEWIAFRKGIVKQSTCRNLKEQLSLLSDVEHFPNAAEAAWVETTHHEVRGTWCLTHVFARTSSKDADGAHVLIGDSTDAGVLIGYEQHDRRSSGLGALSVVDLEKLDVELRTAGS